MRCGLIALLFSLIALFVHHTEAASLSAQLEQPVSDPLLLANDVQYRARRSLASGRWGLRPGKRSVIEQNVESPVMDELTTEVAEKLNDRLRRNLATGRWGLRPGKRSVPQRSYDLYWLLSDN